MKHSFKTLLIEPYNTHVLIVTLNRPEVRNAINGNMVSDLNQLWKNVSKKKNTWRCIILTGNGTAFCAGADLKERKNISLDTWKTQLILLRKSIISMKQCSLPIISSVNGAAFGGGLEFILASDFAYASTKATFSQSEVKLGIIPGALGTQHLPYACSLQRAKELIFTGSIFSAEDAYRFGIINAICAPEKLQEDVISIALSISENAPIAIQEAKKALNSSFQTDIQKGASLEWKAYQRALKTKDREEGIRAFNEKRKPLFEGK